jgi:hypothetical protein
MGPGFILLALLALAVLYWYACPKVGEDIE